MGEGFRIWCESQGMNGYCATAAQGLTSRFSTQMPQIFRVGSIKWPGNEEVSADRGSVAENPTPSQLLSPAQPIPVSRDIGVGNHDRLQMEAAISKISAVG